jgi:hypothetical protein
MGLDAPVISFGIASEPIKANSELTLKTESMSRLIPSLPADFLRFMEGE